MDTVAVVLQQPGKLVLDRLTLAPAGEHDLVVDIAWSGISTGTERLLWTGGMPPFPGMGYPLVPGYESVGWIAQAGAASGRAEGELVFVPGARCFGEVRGLFGGAAARVVVPQDRVIAIPETMAEQGVLLALAATAQHALCDADGALALPDLIIGHGVLGRLLARLCVAQGGAPTVWETQAARRGGAGGYPVLAPEDDERRGLRRVCDASGDAGLIDTLVGRLARGGEIVLAGFYPATIGFTFFPAFMREARFRIAAEWQKADLHAVQTLIAEGALSLDGLITHRSPARDAADAYRTAFGDPACLKMILDWRACA